MSRNISLAKRLLHAFYPNRCACCSKIIYADQLLCSQCANALPHIADGVCPSCGRSKKKCICAGGKRTFFPCVSPFFYEGNVKQGLLTLKNGRTAHSTEFFGQRMAQAAIKRFGYHFDGIVYVPMTAGKIRKRGYNQSRLLAKAMGKYLNLPVLDNALIRLYDTEEQHHSRFHRRKGNVFGVFEADPRLVAGKHLLLVDDIITTGATIDECGKMLVLADCEEVCGVTVASTRLTGDEKEFSNLLL